jgi:hypothetical protein
LIGVVLNRKDHPALQIDAYIDQAQINVEQRGQSVDVCAAHLNRGFDKARQIPEMLCDVGLRGGVQA